MTTLEATVTRLPRDHHKLPSHLTRFTATRSILILTTTAVGIGCGYVYTQWHVNGRVTDALFVGMLSGATFLLLVGLSSMQVMLRHGVYGFPATSESIGAPPWSAHASLMPVLFAPVPMTVSALTYGAIVGTVPLLFGVWADKPILQLLLAAFMFTVNFATGAAFYSLVRFLIGVGTLLKSIHLDLWEMENPSTTLLLGLTRRATLLASAYVSICLSSVLFSELPLNSLIGAYAAFAALVVLGCLLVPSWGIAQQMQERKSTALFEINSQIQAVYSAALRAIKEGEHSIDLDRFRALLELRERTAAIRVWPFRIESFLTGASVLAVSAVPVLLELVLDTLS